MTPDEVPVGTVVVVGHPANGDTATKWPDGSWRYNGPGLGQVVDYNTLHQGSRAVYVPGKEDFVRCSRCGRRASNSVGVGLIVRAWVECPECVERGAS